MFGRKRAEQPPAPVVPSPVTMFVERTPWWWWFITPGLSVALLLLTWPVNLRYGDSPWTGVGLTLAAVVVVGFTVRAARPRGATIQLQAIGIIVAASAWVICAVIEGPFSRPVFDIWLLGTFVAWAVTSVQRVLRSGQTEMAQGGGGGGLEGLLTSVKALKDARVKSPKTIGSKVKAQVEMAPGDPFSDVASDATRRSLASMLDIPTSAVRTIPERLSERRGEIEIVPVDLLVEPIDWSGPSSPGGSIAEPLLLGRMEDGEDLELLLPGDPKVHRNAIHLAVVGMSGAGKTEFILNLAAEVLTRVDAELQVADRRKGEQLPSWVLEGATRVALDPDSVEEFLAQLQDDVRTRAGILGRAGLKQWVPGAPIPFRVVILEEAGGWVARSEEFVDLSESCRSVGICLVVVLQRATHDRVSTSARANIGAWICFGVESDRDATAALAAETLDAGAAPWIWQAAMPGYLYAQLPHVPRERWAIPGRGFAPDPQGQEQTVRQVRDALGLPMAAKRPKPPRPAETRRAEAAETPDDPGMETLRPLGEPPDDVDGSQPINIPADLPRIPIGPQDGQQMSPAQAKAVLVQHIRDRAAAGHEELRPAELADVLAAVKRSRGWLSGALKELCGGREPLLRMAEDRGVYRILAPAQVGQP